MFDSFHEDKEKSDFFLSSLSADEKDDFMAHRAKTQAFIHFNVVSKILDDFMDDKRVIKRFDRCISRCYEAVRENEVSLVSIENNDKCKERCKQSLRRYKNKKKDIFYLLLMFSKRKMTNCYASHADSDVDFYTCNWITLNKVKRRVTPYWYGKIKTYEDAIGG